MLFCPLVERLLFSRSFRRYAPHVTHRKFHANRHHSRQYTDQSKLYAQQICYRAIGSGRGESRYSHVCESEKEFRRRTYAWHIWGNTRLSRLIFPASIFLLTNNFLLQVVEVRTPPYKSMNNYETEGAYLQWRPVSYTNIARDVTSSTETIQYPPTKVSNHTSAIRNSMLYCYFGHKVNDMLTQSIIISLGIRGDGFYTRTQYSTW